MGDPKPRVVDGEPYCTGGISGEDECPLWNREETRCSDDDGACSYCDSCVPGLRAQRDALRRKCNEVIRMLVAEERARSSAEVDLAMATDADGYSVRNRFRWRAEDLEQQLHGLFEQWQAAARDGIELERQLHEEQSARVRDQAEVLHRAPERHERMLRRFAAWLIACSLDGHVLVRVAGVEGEAEHLYGRVVSVQDAVTDFMADAEFRAVIKED